MIISPSKYLMLSSPANIAIVFLKTTSLNSPAEYLHGYFHRLQAEVEEPFQESPSLFAVNLKLESTRMSPIQGFAY